LGLHRVDAGQPLGAYLGPPVLHPAVGCCHHACLPVNTSARRAPVARTTYATKTRSVLSSLVTSTDTTSMTSPSQRCSDAWSAARHSPVEPDSSTGEPFTRTRVAADVQRTVTHGCGDPDTLNVHADTVYWSASVTTG